MCGAVSVGVCDIAICFRVCLQTLQCVVNLVVILIVTVFWRFHSFTRYITNDNEKSITWRFSVRPKILIIHLFIV